LFSILLTGVLIFPVFAAEKIKVETEKEKVSYSIGYDIGSNFKKQSIDVDHDVFFRGMKDALAGGNPLLSAKEQREAMMAFSKKQRGKMTVKQKEAALKNKETGKKFLSDNKAKPGVVTLDSGLQYKVIVGGKGPKPVDTDTVKTHYRGTLIDGTEFDSSYKRGQPASFPVTGVISGWTEALQLMNVGSKWELTIPSDLAYGDRGAGADIGPGETLIFEIELLEIVGK
ncbi:MAG: FKBP-type peptidyl-prolyl cis-trans isomerase, partial [Desulfobacterales bacterium]